MIQFEITYRMSIKAQRALLKRTTYPFANLATVDTFFIVNEDADAMEQICIDNGWEYSMSPVFAQKPENAEKRIKSEEWSTGDDVEIEALYARVKQ